MVKIATADSWRKPLFGQTVLEGAKITSRRQLSLCDARNAKLDDADEALLTTTISTRLSYLNRRTNAAIKDHAPSCA